MFSRLFSITSLLCPLLVCTGVSAATDPTRPLGAGELASSGAQSTSGSLVLQSIIKQQGEQPIKAIISGQLVTKGELVFGYQVVNIKERSVTLRLEDNVRKLTLFTQPIVNYK